MTSLVYPLTLLITAASLVGILTPGFYAQETANWAAQAVGQDWADLVLLVPALLVGAIGEQRGSRRARLWLAGALLYTVYTFVLYAFAVHFNAMFLVYCAALGLSVFALAGLARGFTHENVIEWFGDDAPVKTLGVMELAVAIAFAGLWLAEDLPALFGGTGPASAKAGAFFTNPVHVLDLSVVLPAMAIAGICLLRRRPLGYVLGPVIASFGLLMSATVAGLVVAMHVKGIESGLAVAVGMGVAGLAWAVGLGLFLRTLRPHPHHRAAHAAPPGALLNP